MTTAAPAQALHLALPDDWAQARVLGRYGVSTRGLSINEAGFMHCSASIDQLHRVAHRIYPDVPELLVLTLDTSTLMSRGFRVEMRQSFRDDPTGEEFPHIYGGNIPLVYIHIMGVYPDDFAAAPAEAAVFA